MEDYKKYQQLESLGDYVRVSPENSAEKKPIVIRLKNIPMAAKETVQPKQLTETTTAATATTKQLRVCGVCNKGFSSGRALGGHAKIHLQPSTTKDHQLPKKIKEEVDCVDNIGDSASEITTSTKPTCLVCNKDFPSMKSLFGHLRCHPERQWRGVHPPPSFQNSSVSMVSELPKKEDDQVNPTPETAGFGLGQDIDLLKHLPNWASTDRRGRKRKHNAPIATGPVAAASSSSCLKKEDREEHNCDIDEICYELIAMKKGEICEAGSSKIVLLKKDIYKKQDRYACSDCNRSFSTFQALGGHRSSHSREYRNNRAAVEVVKTIQVDEGEVGNSSYGRSLDIDQGTIEESPSREEANFPEKGDRASTGILWIDLNEVPEVLDDEENN